MKVTEKMTLSRIEKARKKLDEAEQVIRAGGKESQATGFLLEASEYAVSACNVYREKYRDRK